MRAFLGAVLFILMLVAAPVMYLPGIWTDYQERSYFQPAPEIATDAGECTRYNFVVTLCKVEFTDTSQQGSLRYFVLGGWGDNSSIDYLRSSRNPSIVTVAAALDNLGWRFGSLAGVALVLLLAIFGIVSKLRADDADPEYSPPVRTNSSRTTPAVSLPQPEPVAPRSGLGRGSSGATFGKRR